MALASWSHETTLPPVAASASASRRFVRSHLVVHHLTELCEDVALVASELSTNAIRHAGTRFTLSLRGDDLAVMLSVHDEGTGAIPAPALPVWSSSGGRGLIIAQQVSDEWGVSHGADGQTVVWACFALSSAVR